MMKLPLSLVSVFLISACASPEIVERRMPSTDIERDTFAVIREWADVYAWEGPTLGVTDDTIHIDDDHEIPAGMIQAQKLTTSNSPEHYDDVFHSSRTELSERLRELGWSEHHYLYADGGSGTSWGYVHTSDEGMRFLSISTFFTDCRDAIDSPPICSRVEATVLLTAALAEGDDL